ncbi:hypothetical protein BAUCODRAFT_100923 [Baudoinia panamericana UAMH 10762]|uniref:Phospholipid-transporting ATPase n=1 Tax=Baudoinia panamericana (strain UAMH 10762) TaxID=717646 RepID=M2MW08_BAUPA|nr:uncharacterized protein BAUCODRAFT_100923 [Baudoinia panamericana UAMH 10762]EMD01157.1 hypothetical protein BAUCODRAFT_100923 [Baudoinia panamericana UAMH 10762]
MIPHTVGTSPTTMKADGRKQPHVDRVSLRDPDDDTESWFGRRIKRPFEAVYQTYVLELLLHRRVLPPSKDGRHIPLRACRKRPLVDERRGHAYVGNKIRTSRYTMWDFLPKQIVFQATRLHNFYFICMGIPQTIPGISTTGTYTNILPVLFFIVITIIKEAIDDYRRHRMDKLENNSVATVLLTGHRTGRSGWLSSLTAGLRQRLPKRQHCSNDLDDTEWDNDLKWGEIKWQEIIVGDIIQLHRDDPVPADIVLLYAPNENRVAYVETMALDGETNLKSRQAPHCLHKCSTISGIRQCLAEFVTEDPNRNLHDFKGRLTVDNVTTPLGLTDVVFRGSVLRNTTFAIGLVVNTGEDCKIRMNANHHPTAKKPRLEKYANRVVLTLILYVVVLSIGTSMGYVMWHHSFEVQAWYLNDAYVRFGDIFMGFLIMFNNNIPLAMYVSLEIVKVGQMLMVHSDLEMYDESTNTPMVCNTNTILENLGQVGYVLTDKTGTLTENVMRFRGMSVGGIVFRHGAQLGSEAECNRCPIVVDRGPSVVPGAELDEEKTGARVTIESRLSSPLGGSRPNGPRLSMQRHQSEEELRIFNEGSISTNELVRHVRSHSAAPISQKAQDFFLAMALCHTALPETGADDFISFQASSPDELALLDAARDLGYVLSQRSSQTVTIKTRDNVGDWHRKVYEMLEVIEFSSKRKRMSVIVRCPDGRIQLLCKGADSVLIPKLHNASLASRKSHDIRRSTQIEREKLRRDEELTPRNSFGGRPSVALRRRNSMIIQSAPHLELMTLKASKPGNSIKIRTQPVTPSENGRHLSALDGVAVDDDAAVFAQCFRHLDEFATQGLRTLLFAKRDISEMEYATWKKLYVEASTSLVDRQERIESAAEMIEQGLSLLGASAIEDKLQKDVPETIEKLRRANIKIWMLTGDKRETAINIAHSALICKPLSELYILDSTAADLAGQLSDLTYTLQNGCLHSVIVIDGHTLSNVDASPEYKHAFYALMPLVDSVICCRATPAQKAGIVKSLRLRVPSALTLAIGDGANDVAMIQTSHVGVGISGREGLQAARVADFSIGQFRFLQRLLLVHGRWSYMRTAKFIQATFWKEFVFYLPQALYQRHNGYSGTSLYENWSLTVLNTLFTSLCVIVPAIFEQDLRPETLLAVPELYTFGQRNKGLNLRDHILWMLVATVQGLLIWFASWAAYGKLMTYGDNGLFALGDLCFSLGIQWTNVKLLLVDTHYKSAIVFVSFIITSGGWWAWNGFMSGVYSDNISPYDVKGGFSGTFGRDPNWWLTLIIVLAALTGMDVTYKAVQQNLRIGAFWPFFGKQRGRWHGQDMYAENLSTSLWQAMEKTGRVKQRLRVLRGDHELRDGLDDIDVT